MGVSVFDSILLRQLWGTDELYRIFSDENKVQKWLDFEAALALEQGAMGIIPLEAAREIAGKCRLELIGMDGIAAGIRKIKHRLVPMLREVQKHCELAHGEWIHYGPTTQDVLDTATALQLLEAHAIISRDLGVVGRELYRLAQTHRDTLMAGRTHGVQALPITFGFKCAVWLRELARHQRRLKEAEDRVFVGSLVGAVGSMASLGDRAFELEQRVTKRLGLGCAEISRASSRDGFVEYASLLGLIGGSLAKIANEIYNMQRTEFDELEEPFTEGKVGSSTMPHKRNPTVLENIITSGRVLRHNVALMSEVLMQENERDGVSWKTEWKALPECCLLAGAMLAQTRFVLSGLVVKADRMRSNLDMNGGYLLSEKVMFMLSEKVGKQTAHELVYEVSMHGQERGLGLAEALIANARVMAVCSEAEIRQATDPAAYTGQIPALVDRALRLTAQEGWLAAQP